MPEDLKPLDFDKEGIDSAAKKIVGDEPVIEIGWGERLIIYPLLLFVDFVAIMGDLIQAVPYVGIPTYFLLAAMSLVVTLLIQFYLFLKHIKNYAFLITGLAGSVPLVGAFFLKTVGFAITDIMNSNKTISGIMKKTGASKVAGALSKLP